MTKSYEMRRAATAGRLAAFLLLAFWLVAPASAQLIPFPSNVVAQTIIFADPGPNEYEVVGTHSFGVYRVDPAAIGGNRWRNSNAGLSLPLVVNDLELLASGDILMGVAGRGGLYRSTDGGASWTVVPAAAFDQLHPNSVQAITESPVDGTIFLSADDGNMFFSQDGGATFVFTGQLPGGGSQLPWSLQAHPTTAGTVYAGTFGYGLFVSTDYGALWYEVIDNMRIKTQTAGHVFDVKFDPADENRLYVATGRGVWRFDDLTDNSGEWTMVANADTSFNLVDGTLVIQTAPEVRSMAFDANGTLYMATWGYGVLKNDDPTTNTGHQQIQMRNALVSVVAVNSTGTRLFASSNQGIGTFALAGATANERGSDLPTAWSLNQAYPNPFNPTTTISFDLPEASDVNLAVYDVLGREMTRLASGRHAAGTHSVTLQATGWSSGLYLYRLEAGGRTFTRTLTLLK